MVFIKINSEIKGLLKQYRNHNLQPEIPSDFRLKEYLDYQYVKLLVDQINKTINKNRDKIYLHEIIKKDMIFYTIQVDEMEFNEPKDPEFEEYKKRLMAKSQERDYQRMVKNILPDESSKVLGFNMVKDVNKSVSMGVSYIMTLFASGLSGYYVARFFGFNETNCLMIGFIFLIATLVMETVLFIIKTGYDGSKIKALQEKNKNK